MGTAKITIKKTCPCCKKISEVSVYHEDLVKFNEGMRVDDAFPYLTASEREIILTGICDDCWHTMFEFDESEPD